MRLPAVLLYAAVAAFATLAAPLPAQSRGEVLTDVPFANVGGRDLMMNIRFPTDGSSPPWPLVVYIHGGGWTTGSYSASPPPYINELAARGYAAASVAYRLTSQEADWGGESVTFPAQIHDVKAAIRYLRANSTTYNLAPDRFAVWGPSAGGHLSALAGTSGNAPELEGSVGGNEGVSSAVQAVVDYYGPSDILMMNPDITIPPGSSINHDAPTSGESALLGFNGTGEGIGVLRANIANPNPPYPELAILAEQVNPISWVDPSDPPFFIVHGESDVVVPTNQSQRLANALAAAGVPHTFHRVPGMGHNTPPVEYSLEAFDFLNNTIGPASQSRVQGWTLH
ncbi:MAG: alpha/beta hydrolase [Candidatus Sumerlaeia bacterium]|nr:alpha/beta hydrolase [Candidatus Sumerlaeia bacterium]